MRLRECPQNGICVCEANAGPGHLVSGLLARCLVHCRYGVAHDSDVIAPFAHSKSRTTDAELRRNAVHHNAPGIKTEQDPLGQRFAEDVQFPLLYD